MMHVGRGREHPLHVEYVHIGACLGFIQDTLTEALLSHPRIKMDRKMALVKALNKVIWIQNDLFAKWYVRDGDEFADDVDKSRDKKPAGYCEQEGYLDGRKILDDIDEELPARKEDPDATTPRSPSSPTTCPFSGIPIRARNGDAVSPKLDRIPSRTQEAAPEVAVNVNGA